MTGTSAVSLAGSGLNVYPKHWVLQHKYTVLATQLRKRH